MPDHVLCHTSVSTAQRRRLRLCRHLALLTFAPFAFTVLTATRLGPLSRALGTGRVPAPQQAGLIFVVNTTADAPDVAPGNGQCDSNASLPGEQCTLRAAIMEANAHSGDDAIRFEIPASDPGCFANNCRISFSTALPEITTNIEFDGPGAKRLVIAPTGGARAFLITTSGTVSISGMTINAGFGDFGGNISNSGTGTLNIIDSAIENGVANVGGNIYNHSTGTINITNCRIGG